MHPLALLAASIPLALARRSAFLAHCPPIGTNSVPMTSTGQCEKTGGRQR